MLLFVIVDRVAVWMHFSIRADGKRRWSCPSCRNSPEMQKCIRPARRALSARCLYRLATGGQGLLGDDRPQDRAQPLAVDPRPAAVVRRLAGVVGGCRQAAAGRFKFDNDQLFWLAALPGLSGATLRIFYLHRADLRRKVVDHAGDMVADDPGRRPRLSRCRIRHALSCC